MGAQAANIKAAKAVADIIRTTLGPKSMLKMLLDPMGGIVLTNDGNAILREIDVAHPAAKSMIELSRAQDEEVGDGTTSVIILAGESLTAVESFLAKEVHPTVICSAYFKALEDIVEITESVGVPINMENDDDIRKIVQSCIGTKFASRWGDLVINLAVKAVRTVYNKDGDNIEIDTKRYAKVEKIPGGVLEDCCVLDGVMFNKALASALEVIPRTLANNTGGEVVRVITELRAKHNSPGGECWGIDGKTGKIADMNVVDVWDPIQVKLQTYKTAIESACMLLRIDDIVSGIKLQRHDKAVRNDEEDDTFGDERDG